MTLHMDHLRIGLRNRDSALVENVSIAIPQGRIVALVGESGSGKSITALSMLGLLTAWNSSSAFTVSGRLEVGDHHLDLETATDSHFDRIRGREISMIFQDPWSALNPVRGIGRQVSDAVRAHRPMTAAAARSEAMELLTRVGIPEVRKRFSHYPHQLSGGQLQRVMIAMALAGRPRYLIADEPTTALDVTVQAEILALLEELTEDGLGILLITHDLSVVAQHAQSVMVMFCGTIVEQGPTADVIAEPRHPYTKLLISSVPTLTVAPGSRLVTKAEVLAGRTADPLLARFSPTAGDIADGPIMITAGTDPHQHWVSPLFTRTPAADSDSPTTEGKARR